MHEIQESVEENEAQEYFVPWSIVDTWLGVVLLIVLSISMLAALSMEINLQFLQNSTVLFLEMIYLLPVVLIFAWRRIYWKHLGFGKFSLSTMGWGCGLLVASYIFILLHNAVLYALGVDTQGDQIFEMFKQLKSPI